ncbi:endoplasmic reticulum retention protein [Yamadazyma tenuis]|nr:uncharacterized protein CANTEDRAFT_114954 [Yamadazyma tenuis ATCC 10573]EGV62541.1 hypothetical protein CANTEDRAFT_114954 [Yamadazyma tenuis ATCC 10573]WEJ92698.1 endoplasmic reticulum retention protein [Yamadazyma tenuis]
MNVFRFLGDMSHLAAAFILLFSIEKNRSIKGLSIKTQALYAVVFVTRYLDVFKFSSFYLTIMKLFFIGSSLYTVYIMATKYRKTIQEDFDQFPVRYLVLGSVFMALAFPRKYRAGEMIWTFSLWLESVAILPQLFILQRTGEAENITTHYIFALGLYRALYIPNWFYRYFAENRLDTTSILSGLVQAVIYSDFFYIYYTKVMHGKRFSLPV